MDVLSFSIEAKTKGHQDENLYDNFIRCYKNKAEKTGDFQNHAKAKWNNLKETNLKALHEDTQIIAWSQFDLIQYYIIDNGHSGDKQKRYFEVIVKSNSKSIDKVVDKVIKDIKNKVRKNSINIKLIKGESIIIHPYDLSEGDIVGTFFILKARSVDKFIFNFREIFLLILMILLIIFFYFSNLELLDGGVRESLIAAAIFFIIADIFTNINFTKSIVSEELHDLYEIKKISPPSHEDSNQEELEDPDTTMKERKGS